MAPSRTKARVLPSNKIPEDLFDRDPITQKSRGWHPSRKGKAAGWAVRNRRSKSRSFDRAGWLRRFDTNSNQDRANQEIRHYQATTGLICSTKAFGRLFREIVHEIKGGTFFGDPGYDANAEQPKLLRIGKPTIRLLQEVTESFLINEFQQAVMAQIHAQRLTLMDKDMKFVQESRFLREGYAICPGELPKDIPPILEIFKEKKEQARRRKAAAKR